MLVTTKQKQLEALKYWVLRKNIIPGVVLLILSIVAGVVSVIKLYGNFNPKVEIAAFIFLFLIPSMALYTLIEVLQRYRRAVLLVSQKQPRIATLIWLDDFSSICLSLQEEKSNLVQDYPKRILFTLWNFEKLIWLFIRFQLGLSKDEIQRTLLREPKQAVLYGPENEDRQRFVVIFFGSVPFFALMEGEIYPNKLTLP